jgi:hypothetical protein
MMKKWTTLILDVIATLVLLAALILLIAGIIYQAHLIAALNDPDAVIIHMHSAYKLLTL